MNTPKFQHDNLDDKFLGHYFGHDVYSNMGWDRIIARWGNQGPQTAENYISLLLTNLTDRTRTIIDGFGSHPVPYQDYLFHPHCLTFHKAWFMALAVHGLKSL